MEEQIKLLIEQIQSVAEARERVRIATEMRQTSYVEWQNENQHLLDNETHTKETLSAKETLLRELTIAAYHQTGNKKPAEGINVKIFEVLSYNEEEAMNWAIQHQVALKLDKPIFEKIAKVDKPSFVKISEEPRAQIAKELPLDFVVTFTEPQATISTNLEITQQEENDG